VDCPGEGEATEIELSRALYLDIRHRLSRAVQISRQESSTGVNLSAGCHLGRSASRLGESKEEKELNGENDTYTHGGMVTPPVSVRQGTACSITLGAIARPPV